MADIGFIEGLSLPDPKGGGGEGGGASSKPTLPADTEAASTFASGSIVPPWWLALSLGWYLGAQRLQTANTTDRMPGPLEGFIRAMSVQSLFRNDASHDRVEPLW